MPVREVLMDVGDGSVRLGNLTPSDRLPDIDEANGGFALILITPTRIRPDHLTVAIALARSMYAGLILGVKRDGASGDTVVSFESALSLSGDTKDKGDNPIDTNGGGTISTRPFWNGNGNPSVVEAWRTRAQGLTVHSSATAAATPTASFHVDTPCTGLGILRLGRLAYPTEYEFYLDGAGALHVGTGAALFRDGHAIVTPWYEGPLSDGRWGIPAQLVDDGNVEDYTTDVTLNSDRSSFTATYSVPSTPYRSPIDGDDIVTQRTQESSAPSDTDVLDRMGESLLNRTDAATHALSVRTSSSLARLHVAPGDWLDCCDPDAGVVDEENPVEVDGRVLPVVSTRTPGIRWGIEDGQGVYLLWHDGVDQHLVDWSDDFVPEAAGADIEVGDLRRMLGYEPLAGAVA